MAAPMYCAQADLTVPDRALSSFTSDQKDAAIAKASSMADDSIAMGGGDLPIVAPSGSLKQYVAQIATYLLMSKRGYTPESGNTDQIYQGYKDAMKWLDEVAAGKKKPSVTYASGDGRDEAAGTTVKQLPFVTYPTRGGGGRW